MATANSNIPRLPLDGEQMRRFRKNAPAALARRTSGYFIEQSWSMAEYFLVAGVSLIGVFGYGWSAPGMVAFFLASIGMGFVCDFAKYLLARKAVQHLADTWNDDTHVWNVADALMSGKDSIRADGTGQYAPGTGLFVDFVFGGVAVTAILAILVNENDESLIAPFLADPALRVSLFLTLVIQAYGAGWQIVRHAGPAGRDTPMKFTAGARGLGLFLLLFIFLFTGGAHDARWFIVTANGSLILLGAVSAFGLWLMLRETKWLRGYLAKPVARREAPTEQ